MKLRKLLLSALVVLTAGFTVACQEDPIIVATDITATMDGKVVEDIKVSTAAATQTVSITSNKAWYVEKIVVDGLDGETADWISLSAESAEANTTTQVTLTIAANPSPAKEREAVVYFRTGEEESVYAAITVRQAGLPKKNYENKAISAIRALLTDKDETYIIEEDWKITGTVVSDLSDLGKNINGKSMIVQDGTAEGSGICVRFNNYDIATDYLLGDKIFIVLQGATLSYYSGLLQLTLAADDLVYETGDANAKLAPVVVTGDQLRSGKYESMYVQVDKCQVKEASLTKTMGGNTAMEIDENGGSFTMYVSTSTSGNGPAAFKDEKVPQLSGSLKGIASIYGTTIQLQPVLYSDCAGMTNPRFQGDAPVAGPYPSNIALPTAADSDNKAYNGDVKKSTGDATSPILKLGTSSVGGTWTSAAKLPKTGSCTIEFYAVAWKGKTCDLTVTVNNAGTVDGGTSKVVTLAANAGATSNSPYTIDFAATDKYTLTLAGITDASTITFSTATTGPRAIIAGVNVK